MRPVAVAARPAAVVPVVEEAFDELQAATAEWISAAMRQPAYRCRAVNEMSPSLLPFG